MWLVISGAVDAQVSVSYHGDLPVSSTWVTMVTTVFVFYPVCLCVSGWSCSKGRLWWRTLASWLTPRWEEADSASSASPRKTSSGPTCATDATVRPLTPDTPREVHVSEASLLWRVVVIVWLIVLLWLFCVVVVSDTVPEDFKSHRKQVLMHIHVWEQQTDWNTYTHKKQTHTHTRNKHIHTQETNTYTHKKQTHTHTRNKHIHTQETNTYTHKKQTHTHTRNKHIHTLETNTYTHKKQTHTHTRNKHIHTRTQAELYVCFKWCKRCFLLRVL